MMLNFPQSTVLNARVPKDAIYKHASLSTSLRQCFVEQIKAITWMHKLSKETLNVSPGKNVSEVQVFEINLKTNVLDEAVLRVIDQAIPYHILYILEYDGKYQAWIAYKNKATANSGAFKVDHYYHTEWLEKDALPLCLTGLNLDVVLENFVYQIAGEQLTPKENEGLEDAVARSERQKTLEKQIRALRTKIRNEKQLNIQMTLNARLKVLEKEMRSL